MHQETKAAGSSAEIRGAMREFLTAFESFKEANDARLAELEAKRREDVVAVEKVDRIGRALDEQKQALDRLALGAARPPLGDASRPVVDERKAAFDAYLRRGAVSGLTAYEAKAMSAGVDAEGGYVAPEDLARLIDSRLRDISPMRQVATVMQVSSTVFRKPVATTDIGAGWVGETAARTETATPTISVVDIPTMELYAMPAATPALLEDAVVDLDQWIVSEVQAEFAQQEGAAFISGNGTTQPKGILSQTIVTDATQNWGEIGYIATGVAGAFPASNPADILIDLLYTPKQMHRQNGSFLMNRSTAAVIRKFKDADGNYIWQPGAAAGQPATLFGFPVIEAEDMPAIGADSFSVAFGDFERGYLIVDRVGLRVLRDPFSSKPFVLFYVTKRVGGDVQNFDAIKLLKFGLS